MTTPRPEKDAAAARTTARMQAEIDRLRAQVEQLARSGHALVATQARLESLLHQATDVIIQFAAGGTITASNQSGDGACFAVTLSRSGTLKVAGCAPLA